VALPQRRPAILSEALAKSADETRRFRHRATHNYDSFEILDLDPTIEAARLLVSGLMNEVNAFKIKIDPTD
jgi:hypothetical protein